MNRMLSEALGAKRGWSRVGGAFAGGLVAAALLAASASSEPSTARERTIGTRGSVLSISADGARVAIRTQLQSGKKTCQYASVWAPQTSSVVRFPDKGSCFARDGSYDRHLDLTLAGSRVVWSDYEYGNHAYCDGVYSATLARPRQPVPVGVSCDSTAADAYLSFFGDGNLLALVSYGACNADCVDQQGNLLPDGLYGVVVDRLEVNGLVSVLSKKDLRWVEDVNAGRVVTYEQDKHKLVIYDRTGKPLLSVDTDSVDQARLAGADLAVMKKGTLRVYDSGSGKLRATWSLLSEYLDDVEQGIAVYRDQSAVHLLRLNDGRDRVFRKVKGLVGAQLEASGLFYANNVPNGGAKPGRVVFVPFAQLIAALG